MERESRQEKRPSLGMKPATFVLSGNSLKNNQNKKFHHFPETLVEKKKRRLRRVGGWGGNGEHHVAGYKMPKLGHSKSWEKTGLRESPHQMEADGLQKRQIISCCGSDGAGGADRADGTRSQECVGGTTPN